MPIDKAVSTDSYMHFRKAQDVTKAHALDKDECVFKNDFLDEACQQRVKGGLSAIKVSTRQNTALLRNHVWPGYATYQVANTQTFGNFYFGEGQKNMDLSFQL
jgi:hypothetical protein